jgi:hypothetical protein
MDCIEAMEVMHDCNDLEVRPPKGTPRKVRRVVEEAIDEPEEKRDPGLVNLRISMGSTPLSPQQMGMMFGGHKAERAVRDRVPQDGDGAQGPEKV